MKSWHLKMQTVMIISLFKSFSWPDLLLRKPRNTKLSQMIRTIDVPLS